MATEGDDADGAALGAVEGDALATVPADDDAEAAAVGEALAGGAAAEGEAVGSALGDGGSAFFSGHPPRRTVATTSATRSFRQGIDAPA
jgi:hypothetical protein